MKNFLSSRYRVLLVFIVLMAAIITVSFVLRRKKDVYFPLTEAEGGWRKATPESLGVDNIKLMEAIDWHNNHEFTANYGGALLIIYKGYVIAEHYTTGSIGGPQPWTPEIANDIKSSTKSVFGTAAGVFLEEFKDRVTLETLLVGTSKENSLIPQIWDQPITDERKTRMKVKHALSMTSGHINDEPWFAPGVRRHTPGYTGPFQLYEYAFGWWSFEEANFKVNSHVRLLFEPGMDFRYSNFGLELFSLALKNVSGELAGPYVYDRVLGPIGVSREVRDVQYKEMPYRGGQRPLRFLWDGEFLNYSEKAGWGVGGGYGCNGYGSDPRNESLMGPNTIAGNTLRITLRDFARIAYLWLNKGNWNGQQLVPREWMEKATRRYVRDNGESPVGYGYTFWIRDEWPGVPQDTFMSCGDRNNDSYIIPSMDLVVVRQGNFNPVDRAAVRQELIERIVAAFPK
jgi:CubicO group peptidase (beta-lactamase class C family)